MTPVTAIGATAMTGYDPDRAAGTIIAVLFAVTLLLFAAGLLAFVPVG